MRWALLEPTPTLPACPTCGGRGWCLECEATGVVTGVPGNDRCPCQRRCMTCRGEGTCAREPVPYVPASGIVRKSAEERAREAVDEARVEADLAPIVATWPWQPRVRTSPLERRAAPLPGWLEALVRSPDDIYARLDAADAIERDDPARATFVRRQVELERRLPALTNVEVVGALLDEPASIAAYSPELALLARERIIADRGFARGFVEHVTMSAADFLAHADEVFERAPIRFLTLTHVGIHATAVAQSPALAQIRALHLPGTLERPRPFGSRLERVWTWSLRDSDLAILFASPHLAQLQFLHVEPGNIPAEAWAQLARSAPALRWVDGAPPRELDERRRNPAAAIEAAFGGPIAWLRPERPYVPFWTRARATCAGANITWT